MKTYQVKSISKDNNVYIQRLKALDETDAKIIAMKRIDEKGWDRFGYIIKSVEIIKDHK